MGRVTRLLAGTAAGELFVRALAELFGLDAVEAVPAVAVVTARATPGFQLLGWLLGWLLLGMVVFQVTPLLFPVADAPWAESLGARLGVALASVVVAVVFESVLLSGASGMSSPLAVGEFGVAAALLVVALSYPVARASSEPFRWSHVYSADGLDTSIDEGTVTFGRYVLFVLVLGVLLAETSLLFPLPELIVLGSQATHVAGLTLSAGGGYNLPGGADVAERLARGAAAVWAGAEYVVFLLYALVVLLLGFSVVGGYFVRVDVGHLAVAAPAVTGLFVASMLTTLAIVVLTVDRYLERLYFEVSGDAEAKAAVHRLPGLLVPAGVLVFVVETSHPGVPVSPALTESSQTTVNAVTSLDVTATSAAAAALGLTLAVAALVGSGRLPGLPLPDVFALPLSAVGVGAGLFLADAPGAFVAAPVETSAMALAVLTVFVGYPAAFEAMLPDGDDRPMWRRLLRGGFVATGYFLVVGTVGFLAGTRRTDGRRGGERRRVAVLPGRRDLLPAVAVLVQVAVRGVNHPI